MINLVRADMYRAVRSKETKACFLLTIVWVFLCAYAQSATINMRETLAGVEVTIDYWNSFFNYYPVVLPLVIFCSYYAANDFKQRTVKHYMERGISRWKYYLSKLVVGWTVAALLLLVAFATGMVCYKLFFETNDVSYMTLGNMLPYILCEMLCHMAVATFVISMVFFIRNSTVCMIINFVCFFFGYFALNSVRDLLNIDYDFTAFWAFSSVQGIGIERAAQNMPLAILIFFGYLIILGGLTMLHFRKRDVA